MQRGAHILVDVAITLVDDAQLKYSEQEMRNLKNLFLQLITKKISQEQAKLSIVPLIKSEEPFNRICAILNTENQPIPSTPCDKLDSYLMRRKTRTWTINEDNRLYMGICLYGPESWSEITHYVGNGRLRSQCSQRWIRVLDPKISRSAWSYEEDNLLLYFVNIFGEKSWMRVSSQIGTRSDVQCRYRFQQLQKEMKGYRNNNTQTKQIGFLESSSEIGRIQSIPSSKIQEIQIPLNEQMSSITNSFGIFQSNSFFDSPIWLN